MKRPEPGLRIVQLGLVLAIFSAAIILLSGVFTSGSAKTTNPLCTPTAISALSAYWQAQVANATADDMASVLQQAVAATTARQKACA